MASRSHQRELSVTDTAIDFRPAWPDEYARVSRLFARPIPHAQGIRALVAVRTEPREQILSAAVLLPYKQPDFDTSLGVQGRLRWASHATYRDSEVELGLLRYTCKEAERRGLAKLVTDSFFSEGDAAIDNLRALGFNRSETIEEYEADFDVVWSRCSRICERLRLKGSIPADARITGVEHSIVGDVRRRLHMERIMDTFDFDSRLMPGHPQPADLERSTAILLDNRLVGAMVVAPLTGEGGYLVIGRWVAPEFRRGWLNAVLIHNSVRQGVEMNLSFVRFVANSRFHSETRALARRLGGRSANIRHRYTLESAATPTDP